MTVCKYSTVDQLKGHGSLSVDSAFDQNHKIDVCAFTVNEIVLSRQTFTKLSIKL